MSENNNEDKNKKEEKKAGLGPDPDTLHKTDPQENMKGPISSAMHGIEKEAEKNDAVSKDEARQKKDENT